jgi:hypothetical protein
VRGGGDKGGEEHDDGEGRGGSEEEEVVVARSGKRKLEKHRRVAAGLYRPTGDIGGRRLGWAAWWLNGSLPDLRFGYVNSQPGGTSPQEQFNGSNRHRTFDRASQSSGSSRMGDDGVAQSCSSR